MQAESLLGLSSGSPLVGAVVSWGEVWQEV